MCARSQGELPQYAVGRSKRCIVVPGRCFANVGPPGRRRELSRGSGCLPGRHLGCVAREWRTRDQTLKDSPVVVRTRYVNPRQFSVQCMETPDQLQSTADIFDSAGPEGERHAPEFL